MHFVYRCSNSCHDISVGLFLNFEKNWAFLPFTVKTLPGIKFTEMSVWYGNIVSCFIDLGDFVKSALSKELTFQHRHYTVVVFCGHLKRVWIKTPSFDATFASRHKFVHSYQRALDFLVFWRLLKSYLVVYYSVLLNSISFLDCFKYVHATCIAVFISSFLIIGI